MTTFMDNKLFLILSYAVLISGTVFLFLGRLKFKEVQSLFSRLPRSSRIIVISGFVILIPVGLAVGYVELWLGGAAVGAFCESEKWVLNFIRIEFISMLGGLLSSLLCGIGFLFVLPLSFLAGLACVEISGAVLLLLLNFLGSVVWEKLNKLRGGNNHA